jgi:hypothetical protein
VSNLIYGLGLVWLGVLVFGMLVLFGHRDWLVASVL